MMHKLLTVMALLFVLNAQAQQPEKTEAQKKADFERFQQYFDSILHNDWAWTSRYANDNAKLPAAPAGQKRVVFMGNSITEGWNSKDPAFFKDNGYVCRGIGGQVSAQMLVRFHEDVVNLKPFAVVIEAGTNDIAQNRGPVTLEQTFGYIISMVELAKANNIIPIIGAVLPASEMPWHKGLEPAPKVKALNKMLKDYATAHHIEYVDYWTPMANAQGGMKEDLAEDKFVHPNMDGYKVMEPLVKAAIDKVKKQH
jgi:lysophospholipase L1-like esterase